MLETETNSRSNSTSCQMSADIPSRLQSLLKRRLSGAASLHHHSSYTFGYFWPGSPPSRYRRRDVSLQGVWGLFALLEGVFGVYLGKVGVVFGLGTPTCWGELCMLL